MTNGFTALLVLAYLVANLILAPLFLAYLFVDTKRASLTLVLRLQKLLVVLSVALPLTLFAMSIPKTQTTSTAILSAERPSQSSAVMDASSDVDTAFGVGFEPMASNETDELSAAYDLAYFFGDFVICHYILLNQSSFHTGWTQMYRSASCSLTTNVAVNRPTDRPSEAPPMPVIGASNWGSCARSQSGEVERA
jgi:hypothetical protein